MQKDFLREESELAGGIEDWSEIDNADVDRYDDWQADYASSLRQRVSAIYEPNDTGGDRRY